MNENMAVPNDVVINRTFDVSIDKIWQLWTESEYFQKWYGPKGCSLPSVEIDLQVGGKRIVCMTMNRPDGNTMTMWTSGLHTQVSPPYRLAYTESITDKDGNQVSMGNAPVAKTEVLVELEDLDGRTKMKMTHVGVPENSPGAFGWNQALDKLAEYIGSSSTC